MMFATRHPTCTIVVMSLVTLLRCAYVGVVWSNSHVLQLLLIRLTQLNVWSISKSTNDETSICKDRIENRTALDLVMVIETSCLLIPKMDT